MPSFWSLVASIAFWIKFSLISSLIISIFSGSLSTIAFRTLTDNDCFSSTAVLLISKTAVEEKQSLSVKVLKAIVDKEPEKIEIINEEIKENLIQKAIEATKDQKEGNLIEEEDLTDAVTEIIVKTDAITAAKVIEEINEIDTETNLSLEVISRNYF